MEVFTVLAVAIAVVALASRFGGEPAPPTPNVEIPKEITPEEEAGWLPTPYEVLRKVHDGKLEEAEKDLERLRAEPAPGVGEASRIRDFLLNTPSMPCLAGALDEWCNQRPDEVLPRAIRGAYLVEAGQRARGRSWGYTVSEEDAARMQAMQERAWSDLRHAYHLDPDDPEPCAVAIRAARLHGDRPAGERAFRDATRADPTHYGAHVEMVRMLMPKWYGSEVEMFDFVHRAVQEHPEAPYLRMLSWEAHAEMAIWVRSQEGRVNEEYLARPEIAAELDAIEAAVLEAYPDSGYAHRIVADIPGTRGNRQRWEQLIRRAAELGDLDAQVELAFFLDRQARNVQNIENRPMFEEALDWMLRAARRGYPEAIARVGRILRRAGRTPGEQEAAVRWFRKAADRGSRTAQFELGQCHTLGEGVPANPKQALPWYEGAWELGDEWGAYMLASLFGSGEGGVPRDDRRKAEWMLEAAKLGHLDAQVEVGRIFREGVWLDKDEEAGFNWIRSAAELGHEEAKRLLEQLNPPQGPPA